jgi:hypothetical protein
MGIVIFLKFFNSNSHSHSYNFSFGIAIPIPILILELGFHESTTELGQLLISDHQPKYEFSRTCFEKYISKGYDKKVLVNFHEKPIKKISFYIP